MELPPTEPLQEEHSYDGDDDGHDDAADGDGDGDDDGSDGDGDGHGDGDVWNHVSLWSHGKQMKNQGRVRLARVWACEVMLAYEVMDMHIKTQRRASRVWVLACEMMSASEIMSAYEMM